MVGKVRSNAQRGYKGGQKSRVLNFLMTVEKSGRKCLTHKKRFKKEGENKERRTVGQTPGGGQGRTQKKHQHEIAGSLKYSPTKYQTEVHLLSRPKGEGLLQDKITL